MSESKSVIRMINWIMKNSAKSLLAALMIVVAVGYGGSKLKTNFSYRIWFDESNPKLAVFDAFERKFGSDELAVVVMHSPTAV